MTQTLIVRFLATLDCKKSTQFELVTTADIQLPFAKVRCVYFYFLFQLRKSPNDRFPVEKIEAAKSGKDEESKIGNDSFAQEPGRLCGGLEVGLHLLAPPGLSDPPLGHLQDFQEGRFHPVGHDPG